MNASHRLSKAQIPQAWYDIALSLRAASDAVWEQWLIASCKVAEDWHVTRQSSQRIGMHSVHLMLLGFSMENLAKGIIIGRTGAFTKGHDLVELFRRADIRVTADEKETLADIHQAVLWGGRYPVPLEHQNKVDLFFAPRVSVPSEGLNGSNYREVAQEYKKSCDALWQKAAQHCLSYSIVNRAGLEG